MSNKAGLLDTSVLIARETERVVDTGMLSEHTAVSVIRVAGRDYSVGLLRLY